MNRYCAILGGNLMKFKYLLLASLASFQLFGNEAAEHEEEEEAEYSFTAFGDFLYWKANADGAELGTVAGTDQQEIIFLNGQWKPGFRVGIGYEFGCDQWGLGLVWTSYHGKSHQKTVAIRPTQTLFSDWNDLLAVGATSTRGHWRVKLNLLDLNLMKTYKISCEVELEPFIGLRAEWIDFDLFADYFGGTVTTSFRGDADVKAYGLRMGCGAIWELWCNFAIVAEVSAALLSGKSHIRESFVTVESTQTILSPIRYRPKAVHADLEMSLGLKYHYDFCCFCSRLNLFIGYEFAKFFRSNELFAVRYGPVIDPVMVKNSKFEYEHGGDLDFQGLTVRAGIQF